jgi:hypothetical protein
MLATTKVLLSSALLLAALPVMRAKETTSSVAPVSQPRATIKCPGVTNIPFTADAEQALPLQSVGSLGCGESVSVLSDTEGYTAHIRTSDGKDGYVARMYLTENGEAPAPAAAVHHATAATPANGVVRWAAGAPGCDQFVSRGRYVESITANGITVQVSLQDTGWKYRANIAVSNESSSHVDVTPGIITLDELQPRLRTLPASDTKLIARTATHQVLWTEANALPSPSATSAKHRGYEQQPAYGFDRTPDYLDPHMTLVSARPGAFEKTESVDVEAIALKYVSVAQGQNTAGVMWFARDAGAHEMSMRVPVGDVVFDFSFAFEQKK